MVTEREELRELRLVLEREKMQLEATQEKLALDVKSFEQRAGLARALEERLSMKSRELEDAREQVNVLKAAATQARRRDSSRRWRSKLRMSFDFRCFSLISRRFGASTRVSREDGCVAAGGSIPD